MRPALAIALVWCIAFLFGASAPVFAQTENAAEADQPAAEQQTRKRSSRSRRKQWSPPAPAPANPEASLRDIGKAQLNESAVTVLSGNRDGQSLGYAYDLSAVLDDGDNMRVLPIAGKGGAQNVRDILWLRGVDMGIIQANVMNHLAKTGELGNIKGQIAYVAKLFNEEMHILARSDVKSFEELRGKKVNFGEAGSGTEITAQLVFSHFGMSVEEVNIDQNDAIAMVKSGEIAATILIGGKPSPAFTHVKQSDGLKLLSMPYRTDMEAEYYPATLTHAEYPDLIAEDETIDTIAVCAVLAVFNWPEGNARAKRMTRFVDAFFEKFEQLHKAPRHPKWREVNFAATLENWTRFSAAQKWIDQADPQVASAQRDDFQKFLVERGEQVTAQNGEPKSGSEQEALFKAYLAWSKQQQPAN